MFLQHKSVGNQPDGAGIHSLFKFLGYCTNTLKLAGIAAVLLRCSCSSTKAFALGNCLCFLGKVCHPHRKMKDGQGRAHNLARISRMGQ